MSEQSHTRISSCTILVHRLQTNEVCTKQDNQYVDIGKDTIDLFYR